MNYPTLSENTVGTLRRYADHRIQTGGFLQAVLENDLFGAVGHADFENKRVIPDICTYIYNEMPSVCFGPPKKVKAWLNKEEV